MSTFSRSTATAMVGRGSAAERLAQRSLYVRVRPAPASLSERRSVLKVVEQYGKVDMFKKMADNSSFILIASSAAMASTLMQHCPMQYEFMAETLQAAKPWGNPRVAAAIQPIETSVKKSSGSAAASASSADEPDSTAKKEDESSSFSPQSDEQSPLDESPTPSSSSSSSAAAAAADSASGQTSDPPRRRQTDHITHKSFYLSVFPTLSYKHDEMIRMSPLYGSWPRDSEEAAPLSSSHKKTSRNKNNKQTKAQAAATHAARAIASLTPLGSTASYKNTFVYNALKAVVPGGIANDALCDWRIRGGGRGTGQVSSALERKATRIQQKNERKELATRSALSSLLGKSEDANEGNGSGRGSGGPWNWIGALTADNSITSSRNGLDATKT